MFGGPNCKTCKLIRAYLLVAVPIILVLVAKPDLNLPSAEVGRQIVGYAFGVFLVMTLIYRYIVDYHMKRKR